MKTVPSSATCTSLELVQSNRFRLFSSRRRLSASAAFRYGHTEVGVSADGWGANMNDDLKAGSRQGDAPSRFDFADVTDHAERERLLMEELRWTQRALAEAEIEIKQKQRAIAERAFEQEVADSRSFARRLLDC